MFKKVTLILVISIELKGHQIIHDLSVEKLDIYQWIEIKSRYASPNQILKRNQILSESLLKNQEQKVRVNSIQNELQFIMIKELKTESFEILYSLLVWN